MRPAGISAETWPGSVSMQLARACAVGLMRRAAFPGWLAAVISLSLNTGATRDLAKFGQK